MLLGAKRYSLVVTATFAFAALPSFVHAEETYRLTHALGNDEREIARDLSKAECEARKKEYKAVATQMGTYNEAAGKGSITCLPESYF